MDNLTHSLFGVVIAEASYQVLARKRKVRKELRPLLYFASIFANNFPDLDFLFTLFDSSKLSYLLHHRGHTHTFLWIWPQIAVLCVGMFLFSHFKKYIFSKSEWVLIVVTVAIGFHLHIALDFLNSYGVHPFFPFDSRWFYGDMLFIMEPFMWFSLLPMAVLSIKRRWIGWILFSLASLLLIYGMSVKIIAWFNVLLVFAFFSALYYSLQFKRTRRRALVTFLVTISVIGTFWGAGQAVKFHLSRDAQSFVEGGGRILDIVTSPMPGNPFCWSFHVLELRDRIYKVHTGVFTHSPFGQGVTTCPSLPIEKFVAATAEHPLKKYSQGDSAYWTDIYEQSIDELLEPYQNNCYFRSWLQFARLPFRTGEVYNDLRYARRAKSFSTLDLTEGDSSCPRFVTSWTSPRQDLIEIYLKKE